MYGLEVLHKCGKMVKTKSQKVLGTNSYVCRSYRRKTGRGLFAFPSSWIGLKIAFVKKRNKKYETKYTNKHSFNF